MSMPLTSSSPAPHPIPSPIPLVQLDRGEARSKFPFRPFLVRHRLTAHPLFALPRLMDLVRSLPEENVEYNAGDLPISIDPAVTPRSGLSIEETLRRIEDCGSWMVLKFVERDPAYRELLDRCVDEVLEQAGSPLSGVGQRAAFIFVSSPRAVTPYHIDPEHNFLLQIRGSKTMNVFPESDRSLISEQELEGFYSGAHRNLVFHERYQDKAEAFHLEPGDGVHVPITAPHWVQNGDQVSVSWSFTFRSDFSARRESVYKVNHRLRGLRVTPAPVGAHPSIDAAKVLAFRSALGIKRAMSWRRAPKR
jgi:hypothetical protein